MVTDASELYTIDVTVNGDVANMVSSTFTAVENEPDESVSTMTGNSAAVIGVLETVDVQVFDAFLNPIQSIIDIVAEISGQGVYIYSTAASTVPATGSYQFTYTLQPGTDSTLCGTYSVSAYVLQQGGLIGSYYTNKWFSGSPYLTQIDAEVNMNWANGEDLISNVAQDYVSIHWEGFLLPLYTETYTISVQANDGIRVYIN